MDITLSVNDLSELGRVWELSKEIFNPSESDLKAYHDTGDWKQKIQKGGLLVTAYRDGVLAGFVICYPKGTSTLHLWVGGVSEGSRGKGVWSRIYQEVESFASQKGYERLTLNTYKEKFPVMYSFAIKHGFRVSETTMHGGFEKTKFQKVL